MKPFVAASQTSHRPWAMPTGAHIMRQEWRDLLFAHWPVEPSLLRPQLPLPLGLELDLWQGMAWVGVVPFRMTGIRPRGLPALPWISAFAELNVRTYVKLAGSASGLAGSAGANGGGTPPLPVAKPGVWFFSLDAANPLAVSVARRWFHLPYFRAAMACEAHADGGIRYQSTRTHCGAAPAVFQARYRPTGAVAWAVPGSLEHWLTERYCLYAEAPDGSLRIGEIHHAPWPLQPAEAEIAANTMAEASGIQLHGPPASLLFARELDVAVWSLRTPDLR